ncbi:integrase family protein [Brevibacillus agri BAB-2500]|nr:integrase family protein [Brevibacillus agri BAB-2500]
MKGSIEKRGENTWRLRVDLGYNPDGTRNRPSKSITIEDKELLRTTKKLQDYLEDQLYQFKQEVLSGQYIKPSKMTFKQFVDNEWRPKYARSELARTTQKKYDDHIRTRLLPTFGKQLLGDIKPIHVVTFINSLSKSGARKDGKDKPLDSGTIEYVYRILKNILTRAVEWKFIGEHPMKDIPKPKPKDPRKKLIEQRESPQFYDENEAQQVVEALYSESRKWRLFILGSMIGGCRRGELVGLEWPSVNFDDLEIEIENNIPLTENGEAVEKGPKSIASYRVIDMPEWYMDELSLYYQEWQREKESLGTQWQGGDRQFVFHNGTGKPYYYQHPSRWWKRFCERHGIRYIKFHGLRHSMGTLLIEDEDPSNVDSLLKAIQERLGHSRKSTTEDIYVHVTKKVKKRTVGKFDKFARDKKQTPQRMK